MTDSPKLSNPYKPGAGHAPPHLAGRDAERQEFKKLLTQETILCNFILTGLRGVGKTVLLEDLKPIAIKEKWLWVGTDMSESYSVNEQTITHRLFADLSVVTSAMVLSEAKEIAGFAPGSIAAHRNLTFTELLRLYDTQPGLAADKIKGVLEFVWRCLIGFGIKGVVFAYDEVQTLSDHAKDGQFPLSLLLDVFQSIQRKGIPFMLVLVGLPTLQQKLVEARTYSERMFNVQFLGKLSPKESREAILVPIRRAKCVMSFTDSTVDLIVKTSGGYPYFIQFICKELFDVFLQQLEVEGKTYAISIDGIVKKLDKDFFAARWARATDRQRALLQIAAKLPHADEEFTVQELVTQSKKTAKAFSSSHVNQMLSTLTDAGFIYKNRHGRYAFAVPLLGEFILRQEQEDRLVQILSRQLDLPLGSDDQQ